MTHHNHPTFLFEEPIGRMTLIGAIIGGALVVAMFTVGVLVSDGDPALIGAAGLAAPFGGAGFGAMMGAVLGGIKAAKAEAEAEAEEECVSKAERGGSSGS